MKAINVILARERLDRERKKKEENKRARIELENPQDPSSSTFVTLAPNAGAPVPPTLNTNVPPMTTPEAARHMQIYQVENLSRGSPMSTSMVTPPESHESPVVPAARGSISSSTVNVNAPPGVQTQGMVEGVWDRLATGALNGSRHGSVSSQAAMANSAWSTVNAAPQPAGPRRTSLAVDAATQPASHTATSPSSNMRQLGAEISKLVSDLTPDYEASANGHAATEDAGRNGGPYRGLDDDTLRALRAYIYHEETTVQWDEDGLLRRLEIAWRDGVRSDYNRMLDNISTFIARERAFLTWIELKRHLADLDRADKRTFTYSITFTCEILTPLLIGWREEGTTTPEIERRIQQHQTLMGATRELIRNYEDIAQVAGVGADNDEYLRQAFVVLAGEKYAVELQWKNVEFTGVMRWLADHLEAFRRDEEEEGEGVYFVG